MTDDDAIDLGEFLRSTEPKTNGKVRHNDKLYVFEGYDSSGDKAQLRECSTGRAAQFDRSTILRITAKSRSEQNPPIVANNQAARLGAIAGHDSTPLGQFVRSAAFSKSSAKTNVSYKGRLFLLAGHDSADGKILLKECATGQLKKFSLSVILEQTAGDFG